MRILVCSSEAPAPPVNGLRLQLGALVAELGRRHEVRVLAVRAPDQPEAREDERTRLIGPPSGRFGGRFGSMARSLVRGRPRSAMVPARALRAALRDELTRFHPDVLHVTPGRMASLGSEAASTPAILAALDAWHLNVEASAEVASATKRSMLRLEARRIRRFESVAYRRFARVVTVSDEDARALLALDPSLRTAVIPNGVDDAAFMPGATAAADPARIVFTGVMDHAPNVTAAEFLALRVMPLVRAADRRAHLAIVGRNPGARVRRLARSEGVDVVGEVPDLRPWLTGSRAFACAMRNGSGIKNKLLEAMAAGLPSVATPLAMQGLRARPGIDVLVGLDEYEIAGQLV